MRGVILAGGRGSRLAPLTKGISKQLLPVYKYPMIYFPINTLLSMGIKDILIITTEDQQNLFKETLKDLKCANFSFTIQDQPKGLAEAFIIAEEWLNGSDVTLVLGDNIILNNSSIISEPNTIFSYTVKNPSSYGVVVRDENNKVLTLIEKPQHFVSKEAVIGLYVLKNSACQYAKTLKPSKRGELEIVDLLLAMNAVEQNINVHKIDGFWFDGGTHDDLLDCGNLIKALECRTNKSYDLT